MAMTIVFKSTKKWHTWYDKLWLRDWDHKKRSWYSMASYGKNALTIFDNDYATKVLKELKAAHVGIEKAIMHK